MIKRYELINGHGSPIAIEHDTGRWAEFKDIPNDRLSIVDFYAGKALQGLLAQGKINDMDRIVELSHQYAEAMVKRGKVNVSEAQKVGLAASPSLNGDEADTSVRLEARQA